MCDGTFLPIGWVGLLYTREVTVLYAGSLLPYDRVDLYICGGSSLLAGMEPIYAGFMPKFKYKRRVC